MQLASLTRHVVALGASGSGKTVLCKAIVEEAIRAGIPLIAIDVQGDLCSLSLPNVGAGTGADVASRVRLLSVASDCAERIALDPLSDCPETSAISLAGRIGMTKDTDVSALTAWIGDAYALDSDPHVDALVHYHDYATKGRLSAIAHALRGLQIGSSAEVLKGRDFDVEDYERQSVIYLNAVPFRDHAAIIGDIARDLYRWAVNNPNDGSLRLLFYVDEIAPFIPPVKNTPAKDALVTLLRKGRKYGIGCIFATQSPGDLDYKALGNVGTWYLGRISQDRDLGKVRQVVGKEILTMLPGQSPGEFIEADAKGARAIKARWLDTDHRTLGEEEIATIYQKRARGRLKIRINALAKRIRSTPVPSAADLNQIAIWYRQYGRPDLAFNVLEIANCGQEVEASQCQG